MQIRTIISNVREAWVELRLSGKVSLFVVLVSFLGVLIVGLSGAHEPMVADEVVHYFMLVTQADKLPAPNVDVNIPMQGWVYSRQYPHPFLWHYAGAGVWRLFGRTFASVQIYQSLFWLQLLLATWLMVKKELPSRQDLWLLCMLVLGSLPMGLLFSVLFFQCIPATAQVVTAFMLLRRRKLAWSIICMALALNLKVTAFILLPMYCLGVVWVYWAGAKKWRVLLRAALVAVILLLSCIPMAMALRSMEFDYYPLTTVVKYAKALGMGCSASKKGGEISAALPVSDGQAVYQRPEICNHPGDLRIPANWGVYFGGLFWLLILGSTVLGLCLWKRKKEATPGWQWSVVVGLWSLLLTALHMRAAPDARFFLPGVPFIIVGATCALSHIKMNRLVLMAAVLAAGTQAGAVLWKTSTLRRIPTGIQQAIEYMQGRGGEVGNFMMYPEGHERFIPGCVVWYMDFQLRDFWRYGNDKRIEILRGYGVGAIIVKKRRVQDVSPETVDLGLYPRAFVNDLEGDARFHRVLDNDDVAIYLLPGGKEPVKDDESGPNIDTQDQ